MGRQNMQVRRCNEGAFETGDVRGVLTLRPTYCVVRLGHDSETLGDRRTPVFEEYEWAQIDRRISCEFYAVAARCVYTKYSNKYVYCCLLRFRWFSLDYIL